MIIGLASIPYDQYLQRANLFSLEMRRQGTDLVEVCKIMNGLEELPSDLLFKTNLERTRGHHIRLVKNHVRLNTKKYFFSQGVISLWNFLPSVIVNSESVNEYKNRIGPLLEKQKTH